MATTLVISTSTELWRFSVESIIYIEAEGNYSRMHLSNGDSELISQQLGKIEELISKQITKTESSLIRMGKSLIINKNHIYHITKTELYLRSNSEQIFQLTASREALLQLKKLIEGESK